MLLLALVLGLITAPVAGEAVDAPHEPAFERDAALDRPLSALLQVPLAGGDADRLDAQMQLAFALCREHVGFSSAVAGDGEADGERVAYCNRVKFVRYQRVRFQAIRAALQAKDHDGNGNLNGEERAMIPVRSVSDVSFEEFFQQFERQERPVILKGGDGAANHLLGLSRDELGRFLDVCFSPDASNLAAGAPLRHEEDACAELLAATGFRVPLFLAHNYLVRTDASLAAPHLPALHRLAADKPSVVACPHGLNSFLVPVSQSPVEFTLYSREFEPLTGQPATWREVAVDADSRWFWGSTDGHSGGNGDPTTVLDDAYMENLPPVAASTSLPPNALLFVPGSDFATVKAPAEAHVLRFCLCNASNWNIVKREAAISAFVATADESDGSATRLLRALQSPALDTSVPRRPSEDDARWSEYLKWPHAQKFVRKSDLVSSGALSDEQIHLQLSRRERLKQWQEDRRWDRQIASMTLPVARAPAVVNASRSSVTLRWQELVEPPRAGGGDPHHASHGYEVRWTAIVTGSDDVVAPSDAETPAPTAVNVTYTRLKRSRRRSALFGNDFDGRDLEYAVRGLEPETSYVFTVRLLFGDDLGGESPASRAIRTGSCAPPSRPRGVPVVSAKPSDNPTCVTLRWIDPRDDGGRRIDRYVVAATAFLDDRAVSTNHSATAACLLATGDVNGNPDRVRDDERVVVVSANNVDSGRVDGTSGSVAWRSARVCALLPATAYRFRVAASNALGVGRWSQSSPCVATLSSASSPPPLVSPSSLSLRSSLRIESARQLSTSLDSPPALLLPDEANDGVPTLRGRGDPLYELASHLTRRHHSERTASWGVDERYPHVVLSDVEQALVVVTNGSQRAGGGDLDELELWAGHFSPRRFRVSAQLVRADPLDASSPLRNADEVRDRVALVARGGGVPLAVKTHFAQLAGALGVVIADVDDACAGRFDQRCVPGADRARREGFAALDRHALWTGNRIPCALALQDAGQRLLELLP